VRNAHSGEAWRVTITTLAAHTSTNLNAIDSSGWTPLMHAALQGDAQTVQQLLQAGASARVLDPHGQPAATLAVDADVRSALAEAAVAEIESTHAAWLLVQQNEHSAELDIIADSSSSSRCGRSSSNSEVCASADVGTLSE
jgi:ankyrin repeat protein